MIIMNMIRWKTSQLQQQQSQQLIAVVMLLFLLLLNNLNRHSQYCFCFVLQHHYYYSTNNIVYRNNLNYLNHQQHQQQLLLLHSSRSIESETTDKQQRRNEARTYVQRGMFAFRNTNNNNVKQNIMESIECFTTAATLDDTMIPYLWQRGISFYYNDDYTLASQQFRTDVQVNPYDTEEIVWDIASQCRNYYNIYNENQQHERQQKSDPSFLLFPFPLSKDQMLSLPKDTKDRRRIMVRLEEIKKCVSFLIIYLRSFLMSYYVLFPFLLYITHFVCQRLYELFGGNGVAICVSIISWGRHRTRISYCWSDRKVRS